MAKKQSQEIKKVYEPRKVLMCPKCRTKTIHMLFDYDKGIYKCLICNAVHSVWFIQWFFYLLSKKLHSTFNSKYDRCDAYFEKYYSKDK